MQFFIEVFLKEAMFFISFQYLQLKYLAMKVEKKFLYKKKINNRIKKKKKKMISSAGCKTKII